MSNKHKFTLCVLILMDLKWKCGSISWENYKLLLSCLPAYSITNINKTLSWSDIRTYMPLPAVLQLFTFSCVMRAYMTSIMFIFSVFNFCILSVRNGNEEKSIPSGRFSSYFSVMICCMVYEFYFSSATGSPLPAGVNDFD